MGKKFNSVFSIGFSVDHDEKDGSDITPTQFIEGILLRIRDLRSDPGDWSLAVDGPEDTYSLTEREENV